MSDLGIVVSEPKSGNEPFIDHCKTLNFSLNDFWSWSQSDLLSNTLRGILAEFIVAKALEVETIVRKEWDAFDLITKQGIKIEVKSSAYLQSWNQKKHSKISFGIQSTRGWNAESNEYTKLVERHADVYIFCLLNHKDKETVNLMNLDQWTFYVLPTSELNEKCSNQKTIGLNSLLKLLPYICNYSELKLTIEKLDLNQNTYE